MNYVIMIVLYNNNYFNEFYNYSLTEGLLH